MPIYGDAVVIDGGEVSLTQNIDGGEITLVTLIDGGEIGTFMPIYPETYMGALTVTPKAWTEQVLQTRLKMMPDNVTVLEVPYFETHNQDGLTVYIANEV